MLALENVTFSLGKTDILKAISAAYERHRLHGIIGPNGAGKSTLLKNIARIWTPVAGTVRIDGIDCRTLPRKALSRIVTLVPQASAIGFPVSVYDVVAMGRHPHLRRFGTLGLRDREMIEKAIRICHIEALRDRNINELSGGEQRLAAIARALAAESPFILLDEPTADLDIRHALMIMELLTGLKGEGKTILMSIHDLNFARRFCDTITILNRGRIVFSGGPEAAFTPRHMASVFGVAMTRIVQDSKICLYFTHPS